MKKTTLIILFFCMAIFETHAQEKTNPIIYFDGNFGFAGGNSSGFMIGGSLNYQKKENLFTLRTTQFSNSKLSYVSPFLPIPYLDTKEIITEYGILAGKRYIHTNKAWSFSVGLASIKREIKKVDENNNYYFDSSHALGFPFQIDINWFKRNKEPYRIYGVIPVTKNTSFGNSVGFKFIGNVSKTTFIGLGISLGIGYHKEY
ncbi:hypothetical protein AAGV28_11370 [Flavobacterium sp. FZUC8N2.13]|uniref:Outer membrane protein beta-barrel domain-containing protein n=1 Tax=Flavobacterium zubiriense TaxID=3138075 RepID=A0ABV4TD20_9FLAO